MYGYVYVRDCSGKVYVKNMKFEKGDKATPWTSTVTESEYTAMGLNDGIEYDCSGYKHNGTKTNITYSTDTPKYSTSSHFD